MIGGPYTVRFTATNALSGSATTAITVADVDHPPAITAPATASVDENSQLIVDITVADPNGQAITTLTADLSGLPAGNNAVFTKGAGNTSGRLTWTPSYSHAGGPYTVRFTASNALTGTATTAITVRNVDRLPTVLAPATATVAERQIMALDVNASDPDGEAITSLTADLSGLPVGNSAV